MDFRIKQVFYINPDGSGKFDLNLIANDESDDKPAQVDSYESASEAVSGFFRPIDAWHEVAYRFINNGQAMELIGTAYFRDIRELRLFDETELSDVEHLYLFPYPKMEFHYNKSSGEIRITPQDLIFNQSPKMGLMDRFIAARMSPMFLQLLCMYDIEMEFVSQLGGPNQKIHFPGERLRKEYQIPPFSGSKSDLAKSTKHQKRLWNSVQKNGIWSNPELHQLVYGSETEPVVTLKAREPLFNYREEVDSADIKVDSQTSNNVGEWVRLTK